LLLAPDVMSISRPCWGNFVGCQCDSA